MRIREVKETRRDVYVKSVVRRKVVIKSSFLILVIASPSVPVSADNKGALRCWAGSAGGV